MSESRLKEVEALPGFRSFIWLASTVTSAKQLGGQGAAGAVVYGAITVMLQ